MASDLNDLIDVPRETLEIELKEWLDLSEPVVRANIARHLAALANQGGGYLVFGFTDDLRRDQKRPPSLDSYNRDTFTAINIQTVEASETTVPGTKALGGGRD